MKPTTTQIQSQNPESKTQKGHAPSIPVSKIENPRSKVKNRIGPATTAQILNSGSRIEDRNAILVAEIENQKSKIKNLNQLIVPPLSSDQAVALANSKPLSPSGRKQPRKIRRHGRVASLPKLQRDMVNRMIWNGAPYKNIVEALDEAGFTVTERNISNWATGGFLEWRLEQEAVLQNRLDQDHLTDFLRRDDAGELPEVGLQAAATRLSQVLLQKLARADDPEANLDNYARMVELLCRLNREISATQKSRDDSRRTLGKEYDPVHVKEVELVNAIENERFYTDPPSESELAKPSVPPVLPPIPTATFLANQAREEKEERDKRNRDKNFELLQAFFEKNKTTPPK